MSLQAGTDTAGSAVPSDVLFVAALVAVIALGVLGTALKIGLVQATGRSSAAPSPASLTNCPSCGSRVPDEEPECEYCGEPLDDGARSDRTRAASDGGGESP